MLADVRVIAATNRDLSSAIADGSFRSDLFYRLNVFPIEMPPLRERKEDIPLLVDKFLADICAEYGIAKKSIDKDALAALQQHNWTGNIRELRNAVERAVILSDGNTILPEHFSFEIQQHGESIQDSLSLSSVEKKHIEKVLLHTKGNKTRAAEFLGIGLTTLYRKLEEYHIEK